MSNSSDSRHDGVLGGAKSNLRRLAPLQSLIEAMVDWAFELDARGVVSLLNGSEGCLGLQQKEILGRPALEFVLDEDRFSVLRSLVRARIQDEPCRAEFRLKSGGAPVWVQLTAVIVRDEEGNVRGLAGGLRDISVRRKAQQERRLLMDIGEQVRKSRDLNELLGYVYERIRKLMGAENCYIALYDSETEVMTFPLFVDVCDATPAPRRKARGLTEFVMSTGRPLLLTPGLYQKMVRQSLIDVIGTPPVSWLGVPLFIQDQPLGVLTIQSYEDQVRFTEEDRGLLAAIGQHAAMAIERKQTEDALRESESRHRMVSELTSDFAYAFAVNRGGSLVLEWVTGATEKITGFSQAELAERGGWASLIHEDDRGMARQQLEALLEGREKTVEYRIVARNGQVRWMRDHGRSVRTESSGEVIRILGAVKDISEQVRALESVKDSENKYRNVVENSNDGIAIVQDGKVLFANQQLSEMLGYPVDQIVDQPFAIFFHEERREYALQDYGRFLRGEVDGLWIETVLNTKSQTPREVDIKMSVIQFHNRRAGLVFVRDVTDRRKMESELIKMQKLESIGVLAGGIAHDFNNLLTSILGNLSLSRIQMGASRAIRYLDEAERATSQAKELTHQLLTYAKGGAPIRESVALEELLKESANLTLSGSRVKCRFDVESGLPPVEVDRAQFNQMIQNLLINAEQAMPNGGYIDVKAVTLEEIDQDRYPLKQGRYVKLSIQDQGLGIPEQYLSKIFDPFFTTKQKGSGLGLSTVYSIVRRHDGHVHVKSEPGKGTTFDLFFPASGRAAKPRTQVPEPAVEGKGRVLVMDDDPLIRDVATGMLEHLGYEVCTAEDGALAVRAYVDAQLAGKPFHVVIMDLTVPGGMGGVDAMKEILQVDRKARGVVSSGYSNDPVMANFEDYGFRGVVAKPYSMQEISRVISEVVRVARDENPS